VQLVTVILVDLLQRENEKLRTENKGATQSDLRITVKTLQTRLDGATKILDEQNIKLTKYAKQIEDLVELVLLSDRAYHEDMEIMQEILLEDYEREVESLNDVIRTLEEKIKAFEKGGREARESEDVLDSENMDLKALWEDAQESIEGEESERQESEGEEYQREASDAILDDWFLDVYRFWAHR
jgi:exonuclease VII small subunit